MHNFIVINDEIIFDETNNINVLWLRKIWTCVLDS